MNKKTTLLLVLFVGGIGTSQAQLGKLKGMLGKKKESTTETKKENEKEVKKESTVEVNPGDAVASTAFSEIDDV